MLPTLSPFPTLCAANTLLHLSTCVPPSINSTHKIMILDLFAKLSESHPLKGFPLFRAKKIPVLVSLATIFLHFD